MAENVSSIQENETGAVDTLYFPPAQQPAVGSVEERCREHIGPVVELMQQSGVSRVFITQCKRWSCDRHWICEDTQLDDVLRYTSPYPQQFVGLAGYHPLDIPNSIHQGEIGIRHHQFRGIFVHPASFGINLKDRRMYPLFAKAIEWKVPVIVDVKHANDEIAPITAAEMAQVARDFSDVRLVIARADWSRSELAQLLENHPNLYICFDAAALASSRLQELVQSDLGENRCMWGSNGLPWKQSLAAIGAMSLSNADSFLSSNARRIFALKHLHSKTARDYSPRSEHIARIVAE